MNFHITINLSPIVAAIFTTAAIVIIMAAIVAAYNVRTLR